ncbi:hypothetical protein EVAR_30694_1 [Eumeta japonica]|uniref:Uncharacterized protein n=1 Tax=Eumeta variegata TaxID=151549 RepID=A0A4C1V5N8_EUMVA|nr:hypothetical protein EVAR_30694_1 [Eumeta japonica]
MPKPFVNGQIIQIACDIYTLSSTSTPTNNTTTIPFTDATTSDSSQVIQIDKLSSKEWIFDQCEPRRPCPGVSCSQRTDGGVYACATGLGSHFDSAIR